jgi:hypothetical protein
VDFLIMAFVTTPAGTITKEQTTLSIRRLPVTAATTITKGNVVEVNAAGTAIVAPVGQTVKVNHFVALETVVNAGAAGALTVPVAVAGHFVTVVAGAAIQPGANVVVSAAVPGRVITMAGANTADQIVGIYWGKEGGTIATGGVAPFLESFTDNADFPPVVCAAADVIEVQLVD